MKTAFYIAVPLLALGVHAYAQQHNQEADRQPPVVTEEQVQKDAQMALAERKADEKTRYETAKQKAPEKNKNEGQPTHDNIQANKKSSNKPEEQ